MSVEWRFHLGSFPFSCPGDAYWKSHFLSKHQILRGVKQLLGRADLAALPNEKKKRQLKAFSPSELLANLSGWTQLLHWRHVKCWDLNWDFQKTFGEACISNVRARWGWHASLQFLLELYLSAFLMLSKNKLYLLGFAYNYWLSLKCTTAMSHYFSVPSIIKFREVTPFNNEQTCLNKTKVLC